MNRTRNPYIYEITGITIVEISKCVCDWCIIHNSLPSVVYLNYANARKMVDLAGGVKFEMPSPFNPDAVLVLKIKDDNMKENLISIF